jgi:hypothetical protein
MENKDLGNSGILYPYGQVLETRKPMTLLRVDGALLLRSADRQ